MSQELGHLKRQKLIVNPKHQRNGLKNYLGAISRFHFTPTVDGPYKMVAQMGSRGNAAIFKQTGKTIGGKARVHGHVLAKTDASGQSGDVPATDVEQNSEYLCPVAIGTPAQTLTLDFDTGSADLWVFSTSLPAADQNASGTTHTLFDPSKSSTWQASSGSTWNISYGDGSSASGTVGTDNISLSGLVVQNQAVELATTLSTSFASGAGDGLLGLAWGSINTVTPTQVATPVENMITQQDIPQNAELFTAWLGNTTDNSFYTFGFIDQTALGGATPAYTAIDNSQGFWQFPSTTAVVNGNTIQRSGNTSIADTGTTLCLVDDALCQAFYGQIQGAKQDTQQQGWVFPTTAASALPSIQLAIGDTYFTVNPEDIAFQDLGNGTTYGGIQSRGSMNMDIYGDVFLRSVYAIFDQGNTRFGCVQRAAGSGGATSNGTPVSGGGASSGGSGA
ncbi:hypothetical protein LTR62_005010 [Meristemomyces frigidus]|uniref:Peptidase A1 domain-containing protein n=1 Tax=Meristemomyces frigidus TaxID=1508187 RepID=A0AAN7YS86_9PEZI|nr:hypothetical protein LTR62_005010 [Meristemomyces frigidus]